MTIRTHIPDFPIPPILGRFWDVCDRHGVALRLVGGCVRDYLLGIVPHDLDLATPARPEQIMRLAQQADMRAVPTGILHGTITIYGDETKAEITTLRRDVHADGRHALVAYTDDWAVDAARRDFTINALFMDRNGQIFDYTDGLADLAAGRVRFIGDPAQRIREDFLRILRFFRFHARFGGPEPDTAALDACVALRAGLAQLSMERVRDEILRIITGPHAITMLLRMHEAGILPQIDPRVANIARLQKLYDHAIFQDAVWRFRCLLPDDIAVLRDIGRDWRMPGRVIDDWVMVAQIDNHDVHAFRRALYHAQRQKHGADVGRRALLLAGCDQKNPIWAEIAHWVPGMVPITGQDIMTITGANGPRVGIIMTQLLDWWLAQDPRPDRLACLDYLEQI